MRHLILLSFLVLGFKLCSQTTTIDNTFNVGFVNSAVITSIIQPDQKILVGGSFSEFNGSSRNCIARILPNGNIDNSFSIGTGFTMTNLQSTNVTSIDVQSDGKIIVVGSFDSYNGTLRNRIVRVNVNGNIDLNFNIGTGFNGQPRAVKIQNDGKIIVGGNFSEYNGVSVGNIIRLNQDGSIDNSFTSGTGFDASVRAINIQNDGKIIICGFFSSYNGITKNKVIRLNVDGTIDTAFNIGNGFTGDLYCLKIQNDGKILLGGQVTAFNGINTTNIVRLNSNGTLDASFITGSGFNGNVDVISFSANQKILVGGFFTSYNGVMRNRIARLNSDGTLDNALSSISGLTSVYTISIQNDQKIIYGGTSLTTNGIFGFFQRIVICENPIQTIVNVTQCNQYTSLSGTTYTQSGIYNETLYSNLGCDSVYLTLNINILNPSFSNFTQTICNGENYIWNNQYYTNTGNYTQTFNSSNGCDSIVTLNLNVLNNNFNPTLSSNQQLFTSPPFAVQFSNTTANINNFTYTWYWGDGTSTSSNNPTVFHEYLSNGLYTVTLLATNIQTGCIDETTYTDYIFTTGGVSCTHNATINQTGPINACSGQSVVLTCNSDPNFTYQWRKNGVYISGNNNDSIIVNQSGTYAVIISVNGCPVASGNVVVNFQTITPPTIIASGSIQPCSGSTITLTANSGYTNYLWSNGTTTQNAIINTSGNYSVTVTAANGCTAISSPYTVNASALPSQNICIVGIDSLTNHNRIIWEKPVTSAIESYKIYKESNVSNIYTQIGTRPYDSLSVWVDLVSNPAVQAYRYKITALDTCGMETPLSNFHKTIHLTINQGIGGAWNLIWSHYEGINFGSYNIYRGTSPSNMSLLTTIQSNLNSYTDLSAPAGAVYYQIEIINPNNCNPTKSVNYGSAKSNIVNNGQNNINEVTTDFISVFPNPTSNDITVSISESLINEKYTIQDNSGRIIKNGVFLKTKEKIDLSLLSNGVYFLTTEIKNIQKMIVKQ
jgi:uncharacterized delta-60 repeat protein